MLYLSSILCVFAVGNSAAGLPPITSGELADLAQLRENRIVQFQTRYRLTQGEYTEKGELTPSVVIDCEYARDTEKGLRGLSEKWVNHSSGQAYERQYAYDGKGGTELVLRQPGDQNRMYGHVLPRASEVFGARADLWKPDWGTYGCFQKYGFDTLAATIRNARKVEIGSEQLGGEEVYKISLVLVGEKASFIDQKTGQTRWFTKDGAFVVWVSPQRGYQPVRIAKLRGEGGDEILSYTASDFREVSPGVWLPYRVERKGGTTGSLIAVEAVRLNEAASVVGRLTFPPKTYVKDEVVGIEYRVGLADALLDADIKENIRRVEMAKEGAVALPDYDKEEATAQAARGTGQSRLPSRNTMPGQTDSSSHSSAATLTVGVIVGAFLISGFAGFLYYRRRGIVGDSPR